MRHGRLVAEVMNPPGHYATLQTSRRLSTYFIICPHGCKGITKSILRIFVINGLFLWWTMTSPYFSKVCLHMSIHKVEKFFWVTRQPTGKSMHTHTTWCTQSTSLWLPIQMTWKKILNDQWTNFTVVLLHLVKINWNYVQFICYTYVNFTSHEINCTLFAECLRSFLKKFLKALSNNLEMTPVWSYSRYCITKCLEIKLFV